MTMTFDIVHKVGRVNRDVCGLSWNSSFNKEVGVCWHDDRNLEVEPRWHALTYLCALLGCCEDVP